MSQGAKQEFGKWRSFLWPVYTYELKKLLPMFFMFFCISFNYTILRDTKDTLIVTAAGAEAIPFLKSFGVVPAAILFMLIYAKLSNMLSRENLFYVTLLPFIIFFGLFAVISLSSNAKMIGAGNANRRFRKFIASVFLIKRQKYILDRNSLKLASPTNWLSKMPL